MDIRLKLKVKDVEIELSREDAKELRDALNDLVGEKVVEQHHDRWYPVRPYPWYYDYTVTNAPIKKWDTVWMSDNTSNVQLLADVS